MAGDEEGIVKEPDRSCPVSPSKEESVIDCVVLGFGAERQWEVPVKPNVREDLETVFSWYGADVVDSLTSRGWSAGN